jgi:hypothetical protein
MRPLHHRLLAALRRVADRRPPDFLIGGAADPYLRRWWLIPRNPLLNVYLHEFRRSDDDRALHDHPWPNLSLLLSGSYVEWRPARLGMPFLRREQRREGDLILRRACAAHRIELTDGPCWTLFVTGPRLRQWGFLCPRGWRHWREFTSPADSGLIGRGCEG